MNTQGPKNISAGKSPPPLAPFNQASPFELAVLALLLSKGRNPAEQFPAAASLWAGAHQYLHGLWLLFWGDEAERIAPSIPHVWSTGGGDEFFTLEKACSTYSFGRKHLHDLLKKFLPVHIFNYYWTTPVENIRLPKTLLDRLAKIQAGKRVARSKKGRSKKAVKAQ